MPQQKLINDPICQTKLIATSFDNDTKGYYDFVVPPHAMIACQGLGLTKEAVKMLTKV